MNNKMKRVGPIAVYLSREQVNALLYLLDLLDCFSAADNSSIFAQDAEKLKRKILLHGRTFTDRGDEKVSLYFYENEAEKLILLTSLYLSAFGNPAHDYFPEIGLTRKGFGKLPTCGAGSFAIVTANPPIIYSRGPSALHFLS